MDRDQIEAALKAEPFIPFTVHVADGDLVPVTSREFFWLPPAGSTIFVMHPSEGEYRLRIIGLSHVSQLTFGPHEKLELPSSPRA
jgi:hypothetical protein